MLASSSAPVDTVLEKVSFIISNLGHVHKLTLAVSLGALAILVLAKMFKARLVKRRGFKWLAYVPESVHNSSISGTPTDEFLCRVLAVVIASTGLLMPFLCSSRGADFRLFCSAHLRFRLGRARSPSPRQGLSWTSFIRCSFSWSGSLPHQMPRDLDRHRDSRIPRLNCRC